MADTGIPRTGIARASQNHVIFVFMTTSPFEPFKEPDIRTDASRRELFVRMANRPALTEITRKDCLYSRHPIH